MFSYIQISYGPAFHATHKRAWSGHTGEYTFQWPHCNPWLHCPVRRLGAALPLLISMVMAYLRQKGRNAGKMDELWWKLCPWFLLSLKLSSMFTLWAAKLWNLGSIPGQAMAPNFKLMPSPILCMMLTYCCSCCWPILGIVAVSCDCDSV